MDLIPYDVILNNVIVNNVYSLFIHSYDIEGFLSLKLVSKTFHKIMNEDKIYREIFRQRKHLFFVDSFAEFKELHLNRRRARMDYRLRLLYKIAKVQTWYFPLKLKNAFKGFNNIIKLPVKHDIRHYVLDGFKYKNYWSNVYFRMKEPIMRGVDTKGRNFILVKYYNLTLKEEVIEVFFNNTLYNRGGEKYDLREFVDLNYLEDHIEYDYWEYNGNYLKTYIGDFGIEGKWNVRQLINKNFEVLRKLLRQDTVSINRRTYDLVENYVTTEFIGDNNIELTLNTLTYVKECIKGLSSTVLAD
jgi:hypothetical protein